MLDVLPRVLQRFRPVAVGGSPPCQRYSDTQVIQGNEHPDLIAPFRELVEASGLPYWIENVGGAVKQGELRPDVRLCGLMFGLKTDRHRFFETNFPVIEPPHPVGSEGREDHRDMPKTKMGRKLHPAGIRNPHRRTTRSPLRSERSSLMPDDVNMVQNEPVFSHSCQHCSTEFTTAQAKTEHEPDCSDNPNRRSPDAITKWKNR